MKLNNKGFTLVEVLAVIVILGIIAGIAAPNVLSTINNSKNKSYDIMISNIITASKSLYEEVEYGGTIHNYTTNDSQAEEIEETTTTEELIEESDITDEVKITNNTITISLQTLVSNGFISGTCNTNDTETNNNCKKKLINPKTGNDIGKCNITITKQKNTTSGKVTYSVTSATTEDFENKEDCPTNSDYSKGLN